MPVSGDTLLRLIRAVPIEPALPARVIGIDDWAWCRGRRYGAIIVDLERANRPIELLPDRSAETVAAWLKDHPALRSSPATGPVPLPTAFAPALRRRSRWPTGSVRPEGCQGPHRPDSPQGSMMECPIREQNPGINPQRHGAPVDEGRERS
jgi:hypothetical protein